MTPVWVTIVVALASGVGTGLLATMMRVSHERGAELRAHMLNAADEFSVAVVAALQRMRNAAGETRRIVGDLVDPTTAWYTTEWSRELDDVNAKIDDVTAKRARVHLLFGDLTPAGQAATTVVTHLRNMDMALNNRPDSIRDHESAAQYHSNFEGVTESSREFNRAALGALR
jgi:hypothetical protein